MADIDVTRTHSKGIGPAAEYLKAKLSGGVPGLTSVEWSEDLASAKIKGSQYSGEILLTETTATIRLDLSFLARAFKGDVEAKIAQTLDGIG